MFNFNISLKLTSPGNPALSQSTNLVPSHSWRKRSWPKEGKSTKESLRGQREEAALCSDRVYWQSVQFCSKRPAGCTSATQGYQQQRNGVDPDNAQQSRQSTRADWHSVKKGQSGLWNSNGYLLWGRSICFFNAEVTMKQKETEVKSWLVNTSSEVLFLKACFEFEFYLNSNNSGSKTQVLQKLKAVLHQLHCWIGANQQSHKGNTVTWLLGYFLLLDRIFLFPSCLFICLLNQVKGTALFVSPSLDFVK